MVQHEYTIKLSLQLPQHGDGIFSGKPIKKCLDSNNVFSRKCSYTSASLVITVRMDRSLCLPPPPPQKYGQESFPSESYTSIYSTYFLKDLKHSPTEEGVSDQQATQFQTIQATVEGNEGEAKHSLTLTNVHYFYRNKQTDASA